MERSTEILLQHQILTVTGTVICFYQLLPNRMHGTEVLERTRSQITREGSIHRNSNSLKGSLSKVKAIWREKARRRNSKTIFLRR